MDRCRRWQRFFLNGVTHQTPPPLSARPSAIYTADASHLNVGPIDSVVQVRRRAARIDRRKMNGSCPCLVHSVASIHPLGGHLGPDRRCSSSDLTAASASQRRRRLRLLGQLTSLSTGVAVIRPEAYGRRLVFFVLAFPQLPLCLVIDVGPRDTQTAETRLDGRLACRPPKICDRPPESADDVAGPDSIGA